MRNKPVALLSAVAGILATTVTAFAGPRANNGANTSNVVVIQGTVTTVQGNWLTVKTIDWSPASPPGAYVPQYVVTGVTYRVNLSRAIEETFSGGMVKPTVYNGEQIVVVGFAERGGQGSDGRSGDTAGTLDARVVEQIAGRSSVPGGATTTAALLRLH